MELNQSIKQKISGLENKQLITDWLAANKEQTRSNLADFVCERLDLRDDRGQLRRSTTLKALRDLEARGCWKLPESNYKTSGQWNPRRLEQSVAPPQATPTRLEDIRDLKLIEVRSGDEALLRIWNELMLSEHPLGRARLVGRQLRYLIASAHGWLGGLGFGSSALHLESRDQWIGWEADQRIHFNPRIINMNRFLIRSSVRCANLASHVLGLCARRVADDFERRYGCRPWLMESFVDRDLYGGTCYKAANWICVGQTGGRGRNGAGPDVTSRKDVYMYPLSADFRDRIGVRRLDPYEALELESGLESDQWPQQEFAGSELGDKRLTDQLVKIVGNKAKQPGASYARATQGDRYALKNYYRLINNQREEMSSLRILHGHREKTICRMKNEKTVLIIQDTMDMNFSSRPNCEGLGNIAKNQTGTQTQGLKMHSALALNTEGLPLGVVRAQVYAPQPKDEKAKANRPIEEKNSFRWVETFLETSEIAASIPETHIVCIGDRESDIFELFERWRCENSRVDLLVRAQHDRCLEDTKKKLFEQMATSPADAQTSIRVPRQREKKGKPSKPGRKALPARTAKVEVRFQKVTIRPPDTARTRHMKPIELTAIFLLEKNPPANATPIKWMLLTTIEVRSLKQAMKCVRWYCLRWRIEEWHRVLKSGCKVLEHQNKTAESLARAIAIDAVIAWRIMLLTLLGREIPELPCSLLFDSWECEVLQLLAEKKTVALGEAIIIIAKLGGYLNRRCDGPPGFQSVWRGFARFHDMVYIHILRESSAERAAT